MRFIVVGCGRTGATLALLLSQKGHQVVVVDSNSEAFWRLLPDFKGRMLTGVAFDRDLLLRAVGQIRDTGCAIVWLDQQLSDEVRSALEPLVMAAPAPKQGA